ncbi:MAG: winged helix-turn-helix transcriptional regulator [Clostridia bacterium]|nr:winged helix-turn-helix transcriptional regulator [Clostridia bacterium]
MADNSIFRDFDDKPKTAMMLVNEISKIFDGILAKCPENIFFNEKTSRLIIMILSHRDGLTQSQLVKETHMKGSTVSVAITKMENMGYVKRINNQYDMRSVRIYLTEKGRNLNETMMKIVTELDEQIMKGISPREARAALSVLNTMLINVKNIK